MLADLSLSVVDARENDAKIDVIFVVTAVFSFRPGLHPVLHHLPP